MWKSKVQGHPVVLTLYIMNDTDLTVPIILGMDFLLKSGMILDFNEVQYSFPPIEDGEAPFTFPFLHQDNSHLALRRQHQWWWYRRKMVVPDSVLTIVG